MMIDWFSLIIVVAVSVSVTAVFSVLLSFAIKLLSLSEATEDGRSNVGAAVGAWVLLGLIGVMVLIGLYLIIPQFH